MRFAPIAIVGQGCVVPGAGSAAALHELVFARRDALSPPPAGRVRMSSGAAFGAPEWANGRPWTAFGGYVTGFSADAESEELRALDVSFHWLLRAAREALGPVGHTGRSARAGLIIGNLSFPTGATARFAERVWLDEQGLAAACEAAGLVRPAASNRFMSWLPGQLVATALGLDAPGHALDAACASSLYAIKLACDRLHDGSADLMVAGAVNAADPLILHAGFTALAALSRSGRSLPFNKGADGLVPAEGAAVVVIKRLADARAAGDRVLGVIRGIGLSNDGRGRGFLAPSEAGQVRAMRAAYASAEMSPAAVSLLECHATGTLVGDAAEVHSTQEVFAAAGVDELAIGSLKSNLGHLVTAAGAAGIIKVLGGFAAGLRPPMLGTEAPIDVLIDSPFRLVAEAERWGAEGPRVAAVSAFGFGGNNAHLIISEEDPGIEATRFIAVRPAPRIAVVAIGARVGDTTGAEAAARALLLDLPWSARRTEVELAIEGLKFPPRVIEQALPQQLLVLEAAREATAGLTLPRERTGVFVGIGCDPEIARHGLRWRLADLVARWSARTGSPVPSEWLSAARRGVDPELTAEAVVGSLPNIPANRINVQLDLAGPGHTVSAEQASGVVALRIAARALREGELDAAIVGASDLSQEAVHRAALAELGERHATGDAAVVLVLRRLADAQAAGQPVLAVLEEGFDVEPERGSGAGAAGREGTGEAPCFGDGEGAVDPCVRGVAHAAAGLMHVAAAVMSVHHGVRPVGGKAMPWLGERRATTRTRVLAGNDETVIVSGVGPAAALRSVRPRLYVYGGADRRGVLQALADGRESQDGPARLVIAAADERERQALAVQARHAVEHGARLPEGAAYRDAPIGGELAFVFTGAAASYWGMGRELAAALPEIMRQLETRYVHLAGATAWIHGPTPAPGHPLDQLWASVFLCQLHAEVSRRVLGLAPQATIGYSSGETNALFASGAWRDIDAMARESRDSPVFATEIVGEFAAARRAWRRAGQGGGAWRTWSVAAPVARVREALQDEPLAHLTIINTPEDCVIGGEAGACERVIDRVGRERGLPLGYEMMAHCPEIEEIRAAWYELHHRATWAVPGVRHYSAGRTGAFTATAETVAAAITAQALTTLDLPRMIEQAYADGVRVFVEHGPRGLCSGWIRRILGDREHVAVSLDAAGRDGVRQLANAAAGLIAAGVAVDREGLARALGTEVVGEAGAVLRVPAHSTIAIPPLAGGVQVMPLAPVLVPVLESAAVSAPGRATEHAVGSTVVLESAVRGHAIATPEVVAGTRLRSPLHAVHGEFLAAQAAAHTQFLAMRQRMQDTLLRTYTGASGPRYDAGASGPRIDAGMHGPRFDAVDEPRVDVPVVGAAIAVAADAGHPGLRMDRAALEVHASGALSAVFGPAFAELDGLRRRVRMPMPPLLLADRVTGIAAEPLGHGTGTLWTETDVREDSWYLHDGRMPAGIMIESGQADLLLASWIGVDQHNRGERVYRLLGCELTYHGELPRPGETLVYDIHIDAHAQQGDVRLFFFHYDCRVDGALRLSVRHGQAGFFTDEELAGSGGVLWDAATTAGTEGARVDAPAVASAARAFTAAQLRAFAGGRPADCFGAGFAMTRAHVRSPRIQSDRLLLLHEVTEFDANGGPWGRGYLRAGAAIAADDWYFAGHFHNDPCMPGTLMFEGCVQAMAFYLAALGYTIDRDGWRFEPVPGQTIVMRCRGQAIPTSRRITYELFVDEVIAGPVPTLFADMLCTIDGRKAFHARRVGLRLVPDWPLEDWQRLPAVDGSDPAHARVDMRRLGGLRGAPTGGAMVRDDGLVFDYRSLLACAWGRPSAAFGPMYAPFDGPRRVARLPGPPYHFMTRVVEVDAPIGMFKAGASLTAEYDVPAAAWYFAAQGHPTMPTCVLMEAALQPCGWLASYIGSALTADEDLLFRNLDGTGTVLAEVLPTSGTLRTRIKLLDVSRSAGMIIESFSVECSVGDTPVFRMRTVFGFFPRTAFENQAGLPASDEDRARIAAPSDYALDLRARPARWFGGAARLPAPMLCMLDRISGFDPQGGREQLGWARGEKDVDAGEWFFKAHFFQDPVQPGSLGIEALIQLVQWTMIAQGLADGLQGARFEPLMVGRACTWKYRGQVVPRNVRITTEIEVIAVGRDEGGPFMIAEGSLWVDGVRIYQVREMGVRIVDDGVPAEILDPRRDEWLADHRPTWTAAALPMMSMVDRLAGAVDGRVCELTDVQVHRWLLVDGVVRLRTEVAGSRVRLLADDGVVASGGVRVGESGERPRALGPLADAVDVEDPYASGALFHGPAFQMVKSLRIGREGASAIVDTGLRGVPFGALHQGLLDALTHAIPHDELGRWSGDIGDVVGYPCRIPSMKFFGEMPRSGEARVEVRFAGFEGPRYPRFMIQLIVGDEVRVALTLVEVLLPKGPIGRAGRLARRAFLRDRSGGTGVGLGRVIDGETVVTRADVAASDWLPGNVASIYGVTGEDLLAEVAVRDHVARREGVHPRDVRPDAGLGTATTTMRPLRRHSFTVNRDAEGVRVAEVGAPVLDLGPVEAFWRQWFGIGAWPVEDLFLGLVERFVADVVIADPAGWERVRGRSCLYLANHQVGVESLLFSMIVSALSGAPAVTLAKDEHRESWIGQLIRRSFNYPGVVDPGLISFFTREDPTSLARILHEFAAGMGRGRGVIVHVEGTRALACRRPVTSLSSAFLDMALSVGAPVVPVRFVGGLPVAEMQRRIDFPVGFGSQQIWIGSPIEPDALRAMTLKQRKERVLAAINGVGPPVAEEVPGAPDLGFAARVADWGERAGVGLARATLLAVLDGPPEERSAATNRLIAAVDSRRAITGEAPADRWLAELAGWLTERG